MAQQAQPKATERGEAICFTAGPQGAAFGAGVIHAWLASDRPAPRVVAGISTGAITAAAMQRAMDERDTALPRTEAHRWEWFQKYVGDSLDRPLDVIWKAFPDPVDFLSATSPVRDRSCPLSLMADERQARYHFWILTKLGQWISSLPVSVGELGRLAVLIVRFKEQVPLPVMGTGWLTSSLRGLLLGLEGGVIASQVLPLIVFKPTFTRTWKRFWADEERVDGKSVSARFPGFRPLFGWTVWALASLILMLLAVVCLVLPLLSFWWKLAKNPNAAIPIWCDVGLLAICCLAGWLLLQSKNFAKELSEMAKSLGEDGMPPSQTKQTAFGSLLALTYRSCCIDLHIISNYQLKRRIWNRFTDPAKAEPTVLCDGKTKTDLVIVAAALQPLYGVGKKAGINHQCWAHSGMPLVEALSTACGIQPLFPVTHLTKEAEIRQWLRKDEADALLAGCRGGEPELDLVDGAVIRTNPLPALFNWLQEQKQSKVAECLESEAHDPRIHVVYNVPIEPFDAYEGKAKPDRIDLIEAAGVGILMRARRDTRVEVEQTNFLSRIIKARRSLDGGDGKWLALFADEIAPARELKFENSLAPGREEGLQVAAEGCRRTLGRLYQAEIQEWPAVNGTVRCEQLLERVAPQRRGAQFRCGLPEVCAHCSGRLEAYPTPGKPELVKADFGSKNPDALLKETFAPLYEQSLVDGRRKPRVVFVASGGVFRGAFHIGLLGAMQALDITPDLVVGASVGTLMGGALAAMRYSDDGLQQRGLLAELTRTFMHVDETVALTVPVKAAVKELGLRARGLKLSPAGLRGALRAGTASDVGYASTGVPPMVIDTLSQLLIIPPIETIKAGSDFLAGRFAKAASNLIQLMRTNTLENLGIRYAVIGTSLLEGVARKLMGASIPGVDLNQAQPFLRKDAQGKYKGTAIFCTSAYVNHRWLLVLGRDALIPAAGSFRFLYAALSSSAFPAAFPSRQEAEVFPGTGEVSNLFCDGGTFDNLPFIPAIELLKQTQTLRLGPAQTPLQFLEEALETPDLIISGGFDPLPSMTPGQVFTNRSAISKRSSALGAAVKTDSFVSMSEQVADQLGKLAKEAKCAKEIPADVRRVMTDSVVAGVVNVVPATDLHVNPTFGFSKTLGFSQERVAASIADGCFQTMRGLQVDASSQSSQVRKSLGLLKIKVRKREGQPADCECPYFNVRCAFAEAGGEAARAAAQKKEEDFNKVRASDCLTVYSSCCKDPVHQKLSNLRS